MDDTRCSRQLELFQVNRQTVTVNFEGEEIVSDAGLLPIRQLDHQLGILAEAARRLPDPRSQLFVTHTVERIITQQVYQILAGYPDGNDAQLLRGDPLFKTIVGIDLREDSSLASGSTINRFQHAFTRREAEKPIEERDVIFEVRRAQTERIKALNDFLIDVFVRTRKQPLKSVIIDLDPTDDPTHGKQQLSLFHGHYKQHQYFPMMIFEGNTGMPLGAWLRPGTVHGSCGAVDMLKSIVDRLKQHWPEVKIAVRGDGGLGSPEMYDYCEAEELQYAFGYSSNTRLKRLVREHELEENARLLWWKTGQQPFQLFHMIQDYAADSWSHARQIVTKVEITKTGGSNIRYVVTNMPGHARDIYHGFYTQRGNVPERPIGELKNGLHMDRLSSHRFLANAHKLQVHVLAYLLYALFREANAEVPELSKMEVGTARTQLFKAGAKVQATHRRIWFKIASHWPGAKLLTQAVDSVSGYVKLIQERWTEQNLQMKSQYVDSEDKSRIRFAPLPLK